jgi:hypothetical protein
MKLTQKENLKAEKKKACLYGAASPSKCNLLFALTGKSGGHVSTGCVEAAIMFVD